MAIRNYVIAGGQLRTLGSRSVVMCPDTSYGDTGTHARMLNKDCIPH